MSLTNNDFRQLLNEADASVLASTKQHRKKQQQQRTPGQISEAQIRRRERYKEILKRKQLRAQKDEGDNKGNAYRDRAEERRKQKESFYAHVADELAELKERTVEESKFLGGDVDHTHLVKGLDVVLLNKVRAELSKEQQRQAAAAAAAGSPAADGQQQQQQQQRRPLAANPNLRKALQLLLNGLHPHAVRFAEKLKHMELRLLAGLSLAASPSKVNFGGGCLAYCYAVGPAAAAAAAAAATGGYLPTLLRRSALLSDSSDSSSSSSSKCQPAPVQSKVLRELTEALAWHRENRKKKKEDRLPKRPTGKAAEENGRTDQPEADIFSGVGAFDASSILAEAAAAKRTEEENKAADWIREEGEMELEDDQTTQEKKPDALSSAKTAPSALLAGADDDDTYAECYPSYERGQLLARGADSEDEGGPPKEGGAPRGPTRRGPQQFASKAAYEEYMNSIELVPKAAYSYGRRIAGDINSSKNKKKQKLNPEQEWRAIEKLIAEKKQL